MSSIDREQHIGNLSPRSTFGFTPERISYGTVCSRADLVREHIEKHSLGMEPREYLGLAHTAHEKGVTIDGTAYFLMHQGRRYRVVLDGVAQVGGELLRIVRTVHPQRKVPAEIKEIERWGLGISQETVERKPYFYQ